MSAGLGERATHAYITIVISGHTSMSVRVADEDPTVMQIARHIFHATSQAHFAQLSGDYNPIHVDAIAARRTQGGAPIVHGIHSLLVLLEYLIENESLRLNSTNLKVLFRRSIYVGEEASVDIVNASPKSLRARLLVESVEAVVIAVDFGTRTNSPLLPLGYESISPSLPPRSASDLRLDEMIDRNGSLSFGHLIKQSEMMFPSAAHYLGSHIVGALVCSSCLVGMVVPGLFSIFGGLDVAFTEGASAERNALQFAVKSVESRLRLVRIGIRGHGIHGSLETISRPRPVIQASMVSTKVVVSPGEFSDSRALIIGGSRGLGEVTAKVIAAGGGRVIITYATGKDDANAVVQEIRNSGGRCDTAQYDVRQPSAEQLSAINPKTLTHLYYFATPPIFRRKTGLFDLSRFTEFNSFYLSGFFDLVKACLCQKLERLKVFCPSSVAVDTRPAELTEYAMSKAAAEILCADMTRFFPNLRLLTRRLPRLLTDQTNLVAQEEAAADPIDVILAIAREMNLL